MYTVHTHTNDATLKMNRKFTFYLMNYDQQELSYFSRASSIIYCWTVRKFSMSVTYRKDNLCVPLWAIHVWLYCSRTLIQCLTMFSYAACRNNVIKWLWQSVKIGCWNTTYHYNTNATNYADSEMNLAAVCAHSIWNVSNFCVQSLQNCHQSC